jgi:predicted CXXCH cytochrome family protein
VNTLTVALTMALAVTLGAGPANAAGAFKGKDCIDCHQEAVAKVPGRQAHEPFATRDCEGCHRRHGVIGKLVLKAPGRELCLTCHEGYKELLESKVIHEPVRTAGCAGCHDAHGSGQPNLLPSAGDDACFSCHDAGM